MAHLPADADLVLFAECWLFAAREKEKVAPLPTSPSAQIRPPCCERCAGRWQVPRRCLRIRQPDGDDRVDRVRSPDSSAGSANNFNSLDILKQRVLHFPIHAGKQRSVNAASV